MGSRNMNYNGELFAEQLAVHTRDLQILTAKAVDLEQSLSNEQDNYHGYNTDHADEKLRHLAKALEEVATRLNTLRLYTNYPPTIPDLRAEKEA